MGEAAAVAQGKWVERGARAGYAAKGALYVLIGLIAIQVPLGLEGDVKDRQGALRTVAQQPFGEVLLIVLALGLAGYALWRLAQAVFDRDDEGTGIEGLAKRGGYLARAVLYGFFAFSAFAIVAGLGSQSGDESQETARVFDLPGGRWLVAAAGLGFLGAALFNAYRATSGKFRKHLREHELSEAVRGWVIAVGVVGHAARAIVFGLIGVFLLKAAREYDASETKGLDEALRTVAHAPYGKVALFSVAAGLIAYGAWCFVQAAYRRV